MSISFEVNRIEPRLPAIAYRTFRIASPHDRMVVAACRDAGCDHWLHGWQTLADERTDLGQMQAAWIRQHSGRTFREQRTGGGLTVFTFEPFQRCFRDHETRPERFITRGGDWRGNPTGEYRQHVRPADWLEDFGQHQQRLVDQLERG